MGNPVYSSASYNTRSVELQSMNIQEVFKQTKIHKTMNPEGIGIREARDSENHPNSVPIIIALDVTGSMGYIPEHIIKQSLGTIVETIIAAGIPDPSIMFIAIGDHISDSAPLQIGQFESGDKELVMWLERTWLEGRGGGTTEESYLLAYHFAAFHTVTDAWEKRQQKGILITIGDEKTHSNLYHSEEIYGGEPDGTHSVEKLLALAKQKWNVYHIHADDGSYPVSHAMGVEIAGSWRDLLGQNLIVVAEHKDIGTTIAELVISSVKEQNLRGHNLPTSDGYPTEEEIL